MSETFSDFQQETTKDHASVSVCFDRALLSELEAAEAELAQMPPTGTLEDARTALTAHVDQLKETIRSKSRTLTFEAIGRKAWRDIQAEHPPTDEQKKEFGVFLDHDPESFPAAAMAASCKAPGMSVEQAQWLADEMPVSVVDRVWTTCLRANVTGSRDPFEDASASVPAGTKR